MTKAITKTENTQLPATGLAQEDYELAKQTVAKGATDSEFRLLLHFADKYLLDPLAKEVWCIKMGANSPALIMTSRDGYLAIAHRSGHFAGINSYTIDDEQGKPIKGICEVWRDDMPHSFKAEAKFSEYNKGNDIWKKYPSAMIIKVAEVFALKRAFSISGLLTQEEIDTGDNTPIDTHTPVTAIPSNEIEQSDDDIRNEITELAYNMGIGDTINSVFIKKYGIALDAAERNVLETAISDMKKAKK